MSKKRYDVVAKTGEYTDRNGETKPRWLNVGAVLQTDKGHVMLMDRTFNPAGIADPEGRGTVMLSLFEPKQREQASQPQQAEPADDFDQDVPF